VRELRIRSHSGVSKTSGVGNTSAVIAQRDRRLLLTTIDETLSRAYRSGDHAAYLELLRLKHRLRRDAAARRELPESRAA
jgi:hypothetical protein